MNFMAISADPEWYNYVILLLLIPIGGFVFYKIFLRYLVIQLGNNQVIIQYPALGKKIRYGVTDISSWKENVVKTGKNSVYRELEIQFTDKRRINFGNREQTEYSRIIGYLNQKAVRKKAS